MSPEAQRIAIAEAVGLNPVKIPFVPNKVRPGHNGDWFTPEAAALMRKTYPNGANPKVIPDYLHDLNAMHEAEKNVFDKYDRSEWFRYTTNRENVCGCGGNATQLDYLHATAAQRAEAFLRTIGKWDDSK